MKRILSKLIPQHFLNVHQKLHYFFTRLYQSTKKIFKNYLSNNQI